MVRKIMCDCCKNKYPEEEIVYVEGPINCRSCWANCEIINSKCVHE